MKRPALPVGDRPLSHSFRVKTVLCIVVNATRRIVLLAAHTAIVAVEVDAIATTLAGRSSIPDLEIHLPWIRDQQVSRRPHRSLAYFLLSILSTFFLCMLYYMQ